MFYSRPNIKPLGWDLEELPKPEGSRNHLAKTIDGKIIGFRFSSGWLDVRYSNSGDTDSFFQMKHQYYKNPIAPFGTTRILPEQLCDLLGLTVRGQKIDLPSEKIEQLGNDCIDLSGKTTYWKSSHLMLAYGSSDVDELIDKILRVFPDAALLQSKFSRSQKTVKIKRRQISFLMDSDEHVLIGVGLGQNDIDRALVSETNIFPFRVSFGRQSDVSKGDITRKNFINEKYGANKLDLKYEVINHRLWQFSTEFKTEDSFAQECMKTLLSVINDHFYNELEAINIQTGKLLKRGFDKALDFPSYSKNFYAWCLEKPNRYLSVGYEGPRMTRFSDQDYLTSGEKDVFYGYRPVKN